ncbi:DUF7471 family protein [Haladaptatus halobius]|jgi:hypothetical protein|uniref:DUF7471 family protein n=1 Tax=Haladaptatus halobius TaxID=2884875 RepID=UPI001D0B9325|nr:hypothetical protein [Haladaptatus halobius]
MTAASQPLHAVASGSDLLLPTVIALAALGSALVLALALVAFRQRRTFPYLLVTLAFAALAGRAVVGGLTTADYLAMSTHHIAEHALDVVVVALLVGAVYYTRTVETR